MSLSDLYQEIILDHGRRPRNFGELPDETHHAEGYNPLCGDQVRISIRLVDGKIEAVRFKGCGCAISTASASILTEAVEGMTSSDAIHLADEFHETITNDDKEPTEALGELIALVGVKAFPARVKCASLAWHALEAALRGNDAPVSTEE